MKTNRITKATMKVNKNPKMNREIINIFWPKKVKNNPNPAKRTTKTYLFF